jgi:outer membrane protein TolC
MPKKIIVFFVATVAIWLFRTATAAESGPPSYTLEQCIAVALEKNPSLRAYAASIKASESRIGQAKAPYYPQLGLSTGYQRIGPYAPAGTSADSYDQYSASISLGATLFDFGKTAKQVEIQDLNARASRADYEDIKTQVVLNVKKAYYNLLLAERNKEVAADTVTQFQKHLQQANAFFQIGTKPKFDVTKAEVDYGNAKLSVLKAENTVRLAKITLKDAMGIPDSDDFSIVDNFGQQKNRQPLNDLVNRAFSRRADLQSILSQKAAAKSSLELAQKGYFPTLTGNAGYTFSGTELPLGSSWNAGAALNVPLFTGQSTKYQIEEARANLELLGAREDALRQEIRLNVEQAYLNVQDAREQITMAELTVLQAKENFDIAAGRYNTGVGNPIEVADATITLNNARANLNQALYNYSVAWAELEKSIGEQP